MLEAEAVAVHFKDVNMVGKSVERSAGEAFGAEVFGPFGECLCRNANLLNSIQISVKLTAPDSCARWSEISIRWYT